MARLTIQFPERTSKILEELSEDNEVTKTEVLRRAVALYKYLNEEVRKGKGKNKVVIADEHDKILKEIAMTE
jgi:flagellin-specific chaperone FliS